MKKEGPSWTDEGFTNISTKAVEFLGLHGRMLYRSKSMKKPTTIFNANVFNAKAEKIWFGDIEIDRDREKLLLLSDEVGPLYILYEMDGRFLEFMPTPGYVKEAARVTVEDGKISYSPKFAEYVRFTAERLRMSPVMRKCTNHGHEKCTTDWGAFLEQKAVPSSPGANVLRGGMDGREGGMHGDLVAEEAGALGKGDSPEGRA